MHAQSDLNSNLFIDYRLPKCIKQKKRKDIRLYYFVYCTTWAGLKEKGKVPISDEGRWWR